jgi:hypothetical protein
MFSLTQIFPNAAKGFQIKFANGYTVSVQWGPGNYCDNFTGDSRKTANDSSTAETAIITPDGSFLMYKGDDVQGHQTADDVAETIMFASRLTS